MEREPQTARERAVLLLRATLLPGWHPTASQGLVWAIRGAIVLGVLVLIASAVEKTLWDWLELLIVPAVIAGGGIWFNHQQQERQREDNRQQQEREAQYADDQFRIDRQLAELDRQDAIVQAYLDQIGQLLLDKDRPLRRSEERDEVRTLARARTLTALSQVDGDRKGEMMRFLLEADLITRSREDKRNPIISLQEADLSRVDLQTYNWSGIDLTAADLEDADLSVCGLRDSSLASAYLINARLIGTSLDGADLNGAGLRGAILEGASLRGASLFMADLTDADLTDADLTGADLAGESSSIEEAMEEPEMVMEHRKLVVDEPELVLANLVGADLTGADLTDAKVTQDQLDQAKYA